MKTYPLIFRWPALLLGAWLLGAAGLSGCASDKNLVSHTMNNIAARDNAYFMARTKLAEVENKLYAGRTNNYNEVLALFPTLDSAAVKANRADLIDIIKKASMPIQNRPGSDWTDDAYLLVGWARYYQMQFEDAALTFKYINSTSKDPNSKHEALIGLMRTFVATKDFESAKAISDILDKETGLPKNARELFLTRADYYLRTEQPAEAIPQLEKAIPLIEQKNERSRTRYILAQLYQEAGEDKKAYAQLNQILKKNPPYELDFFTKLMLAQVSDLSQQDRERLDKYFAALLKDPKNKEYRDKIYYEMGRLAYRQKNYSDALKQLQLSARATTTNRSQKSYTYLLAGRIYYENLQKYRLAAAYYDSTVQNMTPEVRNYTAIKERSEILQEFAKQYTIIESQDSLQTLAKLEKGALDEQLAKYADAEIAAKKKAAEQKALAEKVKARAADLEARKSSNSPDGPGSMLGAKNNYDPTQFDPLATGSGTQWYFDNPATLGIARNDFIRKWGDRKLQDNWRTSSQSNTNSPNAPGNGGAPLTVTGNPTRANTAAIQDSLAKAKAASDPDAERRELIAKYRKDLPLTPGAIKESDVKIEAAYYALGSIYKEELKELESGMGTYEKQVKRYEIGAHAPEADYLLYLYYKNKPDAPKSAEYAAALQRNFPNSIYAKLIADPQYREHELALHKAVSARVDSAFVYYKDQEFRKAAAVLARTERQYPKNDLNDRIAYLKTLLVARTQPPLTARSSVEQFYKSYPQSPLVAQAQALAQAYERQAKGEITGALASTDKPVISQFRPGEVDNRLRIFYAENESPAVAVPTTPAPTPQPAAPTPTTPAAGKLPAPGPNVLKPVTPAPTGSAGPQPAGASTPAAPSSPASTPAGGTAPSTSAPAPTGSGSTTAAAGSAAAPAPAAPTTAYTTQLSAAHAVVLVFSKTAPAAADLTMQLAAYNSRFYRDNNLQVQPQSLDATQDLVVVRALQGAKLAQSYATKLRGPQSPLARLRGQGYQTLVISIENLTLLQAAGDLAGYQSFYQRVYK